jgi:hypothetical protein
LRELLDERCPALEPGQRPPCGVPVEDPFERGVDAGGLVTSGASQPREQHDPLVSNCVNRRRQADEAVADVDGDDPAARVTAEGEEAAVRGTATALLSLLRAVVSRLRRGAEALSVAPDGGDCRTHRRLGRSRGNRQREGWSDLSADAMVLVDDP